MRNAGLLRRLSDTAGDFVDDDIVVGSVATKKTSKANDGVVLCGFGQGTRGRGDFKCAGNADNFNILSRRTAAQETVKCAVEKSFGDESVKA